MENPRRFRVFAIALSILCFSILWFNIGNYNVNASSNKYPNIYYFTTNASNHSISLKWRKGYRPSSYIIWRKIAGGHYKKIKTLSKSKLSYTDKNVKNGMRYYYKVEVNRKGTNYRSKAFGVTLTNLTIPKLNSVSTYNNGNKISNKLTFKTNSSKYYMIYRKTGNGSWTLIKTISSKPNVSYSYSDNGLNKSYNYTYTVKSKNVSKTCTKYGKYDATGITTIKDIPKVNTIKTSEALDVPEVSDGLCGAPHNNNQLLEIEYSKIPGVSEYRLYTNFASLTSGQVSGSWAYVSKASNNSTYISYSFKPMAIHGVTPICKVQGVKTIGNKISYSDGQIYSLDDIIAVE
ncbi:MAG: hypothetical protein LBM02_08755 [Lachnospiraceae bacterium]|jgi:hypothetical protein|nr:hypothetical protein [Lachnospiraceae bacterium]